MDCECFQRPVCISFQNGYTVHAHWYKLFTTAWCRYWMVIIWWCVLVKRCLNKHKPHLNLDYFSVIGMLYLSEKLVGITHSKRFRGKLLFRNCINVLIWTWLWCDCCFCCVLYDVVVAAVFVVIAVVVVVVVVL